MASLTAEVRREMDAYEPTKAYRAVADFVDDLSSSLDGATAARAMYALGKYDVDSNVFTAAKLGILLID